MDINRRGEGRREENKFTFVEDEDGEEYVFYNRDRFAVTSLPRRGWLARTNGAAASLYIRIYEIVIMQMKRANRLFDTHWPFDPFRGIGRKRGLVIKYSFAGAWVWTSGLHSIYRVDFTISFDPCYVRPVLRNRSLISFIEFILAPFMIAIIPIARRRFSRFIPKTMSQLS